MVSKILWTFIITITKLQIMRKVVKMRIKNFTNYEHSITFPALFILDYCFAWSYQSIPVCNSFQRKTELSQTILLYNTNKNHLFQTSSALVTTRGDEELRLGGRREKSFWRLIFQEILARDARCAYTEIADCLRPYCTAKHGNRYNLLRSSFVQFQSTTIHSLGSILTQSNTAKILFSCYLQICPESNFSLKCIYWIIFVING